MPSDAVTLAHGSGGRASRELLRTIVETAFGASVTRDDCARVPNDGGTIAFTTDTFVVTPRFFPGGDIGSLAVHGTVNDLAVGGAVPKYLSCGFVAEEGLALAELATICESMRQAAEAAGVQIVTGDTQVVPRGEADGLYINTSGVGFIPQGRVLEHSSIRPGDVVVINGDIGRHGACVAGMRQDYGLEHNIQSDSANLAPVCAAMLEAGAVRYLRDATRGGVGAVVTELANESGCQFTLDESAIAVQPSVRALCELLGLSPLHLACEGRLVGVVAAADADAIVAAMRAVPEGSGSRIIGEVRAGAEPPVTIKTMLGTETVLSLPAGELLPRIC